MIMKYSCGKIRINFKFLTMILMILNRFYLEMKVVKALFNGQDIQPIEPIKMTRKTEVLVIFPNDAEKYAPEETRRLLRGSGKGEMLTEKLLKSRIEDIKLERR